MPLIMAWHEGIEGQGRTVSTIVEALDVVPTILDDLGVPKPTTLQGRSLQSELRRVPATRGEIGITEHHGWRSVRTPGHRCVVHADGREHLWDISVDPSSEDEVVERRDSVLAEHRKLLIERTLSAERPLARTWA